MSGGDGIARSNRNVKRVEPLIGVKELKERYLFGIDIKDKEGNPLSLKAYQSYINTAISMLETDLDIKIVEEENSDEPEFHDYHRNEYESWGYLNLYNIPVISITSLEFVYTKDESGEYVSVLEIPSQWLRVNKHEGSIRMVPSASFPAQLSVGTSGIFYPDIFSRWSHLPNMWRVIYKYGFESGKTPVLINTAVGLLAAIYALNIGGDLVLGAGIASKSIGLDALNESINTTSSAENHAYSAKVKEYQRLLYGPSIAAADRGIIRRLRDFYQGSPIQSI